jgi:tetratricopeptide (TPR) repeat protein
MSRAARKLQQRCEALADQARALQASGRSTEALERFQEAVEIARQLAQDGVANLQLLLVQGTALHSLGQLHADAGRAEQALAALDDCVQVCDELGTRYQADARRLLAEARLSLGWVKSRMGMGASAVLELDKAVNVYLALLRETQGLGEASTKIALGVCRTLVANGEVLMMYGDPDLAATSVNMGWRVYIGQHEAPGWDVATMGQLAMTASDVLARIGRLEDATWADVAAAKAAGDVAEASGSAAARRTLAAVLANRGLHLMAAGEQGILPQDDERGDAAETAAACLAQSRALDPGAAQEMTDRWGQAQAEGPPVTLAAAMGTAVRVLGPDRVPADLVAAFGSPPPETAVSPSGRCDRRLAAQYARKLADVSTALLPQAASEGLRIGLEAHYLFDIGWSDDPYARARAREWAIPWARLVLECCKALVADSELAAGPSLAVDLASQTLTWIEYLRPWLRGDGVAPDAGDQAQDGDRAVGGDQDEIAEVFRDCLTQVAELLTGAGQGEAAQLLKNEVSLIGDRMPESS